MPNQNYQAIKYCKSPEPKPVVDTLVIEEALKISINNDIFSITMRTPSDDNELVLGLLYSEDIFTGDVSLVKMNAVNQDAITHFNIDIPNNLLRKGYLNSRSLLSVASCGICGKTDLPEVKGHIKHSDKLNIDDLNKMFKLMSSKQDLFLRSGGSHAAAIFDKKNILLSLKEDIGRHNAVDKTIGDLLIKKQLKEAFCLLVSGRVSYEIIIKAFRAKIPVLAAVSAPSSLAVDFAKELGITLLGFCREGKATCYANDYRIDVTNE